MATKKNPKKQKISEKELRDTVGGADRTTTRTIVSPTAKSISKR